MPLKKQVKLKLLMEMRKDWWDCKSVVLQLSGSVLEGVHGNLGPCRWFADFEKSKARKKINF